MQDTSSTSNRFAAATSSEDITKIIKSTESRSTRKSMTWSVQVFEEWRNHRNAQAIMTQPIPALPAMNAQEMNTYLSHFLLEIRRKDSSEYPGRTLYCIMTGILRHLKQNGNYNNFLDKNNMQFSQLRNVLDARMKQLHSQGIGVKKRQAEAITPRKEDVLWTSGQLGLHTSYTMINTVFYYNCKLFGLRGMDEHHDLQCEQFHLGQDKDGCYVEYVGRFSKSLNGGIKQRKLTSKDIRHYVTNRGSERDLYTVYEQYLGAVGNTGYFYKQPSKTGHLKFYPTPIGKNKLGTIVKEMCAKAGLIGNFTNQPIRQAVLRHSPLPSGSGRTGNMSENRPSQQRCARV